MPSWFSKTGFNAENIKAGVPLSAEVGYEHLKKSEEMAKKIPGLEYYIIYSAPDGKTKTAFSEGLLEFFADKTEVLEKH